jgi:predicted MPP superfamily phosphohydrolase
MNSRIIMVTVAAVVLVGVCFFTARMFASGLRLNSQTTRWAYIVSLVLPFLYVASLIGSRANGVIGSLPYAIINIIAGLFFYIMLGALLLGIISVGYAIAGTPLPVFAAGGVLALSVLAALTGFVQARTIVVTEYAVILKNAPESWNGKTAALISDTHFGLVNYTKFSDKVVNKIISLHPDFVLHAGDFYDGPIVDTAPITASWKKLTAIVPVFYAPGNHEGYGNYSTFVDSVRNAGATLLDDKKVEYEGVQIAGITFRDGKDNPAAATAIAALQLNPNEASILINHPPTALAAASDARVSLMVSGHTHRGQFWPLNYITKAVFGEYYYGSNPFKDMTVITSDGIGTFGPPIRFLNNPEVVLIHFVTQ